MGNKECFECGKPATEDHHVIPQSLGGTKTVPLCGCCHDRVHDGGWRRRDSHAALTKAGIARSKANGGKFGADVIPREALERGVAKSREKNMAQALEFAESMAPRLLQLRNMDMTLQEISDVLNLEGSRTQRGGKWYPTTICNILDKLGLPRTKKLGIDLVYIKQSVNDELSSIQTEPTTSLP